ncbi:putative ribonuclease H-like domain-containing protein [Tanacetum coccineum]
MEFESAQSNTTSKLPILKLENGNSWVSVPQTAQENGTSVTKMLVPVTAEEKTNKKNDVKARSLLLMALPNEHQLTFSQYSDAKTMLAAIETRFGGNEATKKTQKTLLKQQYENFSASSTESLDSIFNRLQKIAELETMSIDDLYNNFKIVEQSLKKYVGASSGAQNLAFMTAPSTSSTNDVNTAKPAYEVSTISPNVNTASPQQTRATFSEVRSGSNGFEVAALSVNKMRAIEYDKSKVECFNCHKMGHFARECRAPRNKEGQFRNQDNTRKQGNNEDTSSKAMLAIDGVGFDWSDMAEEQVQTNMALMAFSDSEVYNDKTCSKTCLKNYETLKKQCDDLIVKLNQTEFTAATYKRGLATVEEQLITYRKNEVLFSEEVAVLKREVACKDYEINVLKSEFEKVKQEKEGIEFKIEKFDNASKSLNKLLESQITEKSKKGLGYNFVPLPHFLIYNRLKKLDLSYSGLDEFNDPKFKSYGSEDKQVSEDTSSFVESSLNVEKETVFLDKKIEFVKPKNHEKPVKKSVRTHPNAQRNMVPRAVLMKTGLKPFNTARTVNTAHPKSQFLAKAVNTARPQSAVVNVVRVNKANAVKALACWGKLLMDDKGFVDSGCSRHMNGNIAYLLDFKEFDGGYVTFGRGAHDGRISDKGTLKTDSLDFKDVYFVNELNFNLFSVSHMCDKKNYVLFTDTECLVLYPNFKLPDEDNLGKFNGKSDEGFFVGYSLSSTSIQKEEISQDCIVMPIWKDASYFDSPSKDVGNGEPKSAADDQKKVEYGPDNENDEKDKSEDDSSPKEVNTAGQHVNTASPGINTGHFKLNIVDLSVNTASSYDPDNPKDMFKMGASYTLEATHVEAIQEELLQFKLQHVWKLVDLPNRKRAIGTKWVFRNKKDERGIVIRNKARLVAQGHRQEEGIDYEEVFAPVARIEAIRLFLAYASFMGFLVYQMDVKSAFLYETIEEEVYVTQPPGFKDPENPDKVYKVVKALYGLHQAPRAWYETLANYLLGNGFKRGKIDQTLFIKKQKGDILLVQVYVDDIIFGSTNKELCTGFEKLMKDKFQMSSMGELTFFLGLQSCFNLVDLEKPLVKDGDANDVDVHLYRSMIRSLMYLTASRPDIMFAVCACARFQVTPKTSHLLAIKRIFRYLKGKPTLGLWYSRDSPFELVAYTDSDYAGATQDRKSITGGYLLTKGFDAGRHVKRGRDTKIPQSSGPPVKVGDEAVHKELGDKMERAATTASSLEAEQDNEFCDTHNMVSYLLKPEGSEYFQQIFWQTASTSTLKDGEVEITATIDGQLKTITEASLRRHLKLEDADGISSLPNTEIFEQLALMGYVSDSDKLTFQNGHFSPQWRFLIHTILRCLSPKKTAWE